MKSVFPRWKLIAIHFDLQIYPLGDSSAPKTEIIEKRVLIHLFVEMQKRTEERLGEQHVSNPPHVYPVLIQVA